VLVLALLVLCQTEAADAFARAEELACKGRHADARLAYERIVKKFPGTPEALRAEVRTRPSALLGACKLVDNGPSENRVDIVLFGDGYELDHQKAFDKLAADVPPFFDRVEVFREYWSYLNFIRGVCLSADSGVDGFGREYDTLFNAYTGGTDAGHVVIDGQRVHEVLREIPGSDGIAVVYVKLGILGTGGGGIATIGGREEGTTVHEFGHAFAGLGDEYSSHTHKRGAPSDGINVAASEDEERCPWRHWLEAKHPSVGMYEGASGQPQDAWRPTASGCLMNDGSEFCPVCREAVVLRIYSLVDPIERAEPPAPGPYVREPVILTAGRTEFRVEVMQPASHRLEVSWWFESAARYPLSPGSGDGEPAPVRREARTRSERGPLPAMGQKPMRHGRAESDGESVLSLLWDELEPGLYRVTCRVTDTTKLPGERFPWVLKDERGLLASERVWWLEVR
jgi:hypothetical protein